MARVGSVRGFEELRNLCRSARGDCEGLAEMNNEHAETLKHWGDGVSLLIAAGAFAKILPPLSALIAIVYTLIRIWESKTVQGFRTYIKGE